MTNSSKFYKKNKYYNNWYFMVELTSSVNDEFEDCNLVIFDVVVLVDRYRGFGGISCLLLQHSEYRLLVSIRQTTRLFITEEPDLSYDFKLHLFAA
jgi:hypothetical protein